MTVELSRMVNTAGIYELYAGSRRPGYLRGVQPGIDVPSALLKPVALMQNLAADELRPIVEGHMGGNRGYELILGTIRDAEENRLKLHAAAIKGDTNIGNVVKAHYSELKALSNFLPVLNRVTPNGLAPLQRLFLGNSIKGFELAIAYANVMYDKALGFICFVARQFPDVALNIVLPNPDKT